MHLFPAISHYPKVFQQRGSSPLVAILGTCLWMAIPAVPAVADTGPQFSYQGNVEASRQTVLAAQVSGTIVALLVQEGQRVGKGQVLVRLDDLSQRQNTAAMQAQVQAADAQSRLAQQDFKRQQLLFAKNYISKAALDRAQAQLNSTAAQATALRAQVSASQAQTGYYQIRAPYAAVVSEVPVSLGDMAIPGKPLLTLYDPASLRASVSVPLSVAGALEQSSAPIRLQLGTQPTLSFQVKQIDWLPQADVQTQSRVMRLRLPAGTHAVPGEPLRVTLSLPEDTQKIDPARSRTEAPYSLGQSVSLGKSVWIPAQSVVQRAELTAVYVVAAGKKHLLRQVRLGERRGTVVEVLSGLSLGERVLLRPEQTPPQSFNTAGNSK